MKRSMDSRSFWGISSILLAPRGYCITRDFKCVWYEGVALQIARDANRVDARNLDRIGELGRRARLGQHRVSELVETQPQVLSRISIERGAIRQMRILTLSVSRGTWLCRHFSSICMCIHGHSTNMAVTNSRRLKATLGFYAR